MTKKFFLATLAYLIPTMILGMAWHFIFFKDLYESLGIYNRAEPIIPLGFASMAIQGLIVAYLFPIFYREGNAIISGIKFGLIMGLFLFSVSTLANAAKIEVTSMSSWITIQIAFHLIQFLLVGVGIGLVYRKGHP
jgi:hypothetical protein